ncbi:Ig-like domain-containing protein [Acetobacterium sp.]|uniref:Ig-like domain-containing protein n=1 Tax=Acetobacterium sp. TaxID=1872094 RepID=UPI0035932062
MQRKKFPKIFITGLLVVCIFMAFSPTGLVNAQDAPVKISVNHGVTGIDENTTLDVSMDPGSNVSALQFVFSFDPTKIKYVQPEKDNLAKGDDLKTFEIENGAGSIVINANDAAAGKVTIGYINASSPLTFGGSLFELTFEGVDDTIGTPVKVEVKEFVSGTGEAVSTAITNGSITVTKPMDEQEIRLNKTGMVISVGENQELKVIFSNANEDLDNPVNWESSDSNVASVKDGIVTGNKAGTTMITAKVGDKTATCKVTVQTNEVPKENPACTYRTHVQNEGWQEWKTDGDPSGTSGKSLRLEGIEIKADSQDYDLGIEYQTHVENIGWQGFKSNGIMSGTSGQSLRLEAIQLKLTGNDADKFDIYYQVHAQNFGWLDWAKNGKSAGTAGFGYRLEAIKILMVPTGDPAPGATDHAFEEK